MATTRIAHLPSLNLQQRKIVLPGDVAQLLDDVHTNTGMSWLPYGPPVHVASMALRDKGNMTRTNQGPETIASHTYLRLAEALLAAVFHEQGGTEGKALTVGELAKMTHLEASRYYRPPPNYRADLYSVSGTTQQLYS